MHQTNGGFVYIGLNADCSCKYASINTHNYNKLDGIMQTNLSRDKVGIVIRFKAPFQTNRWHQPTSITRISQSNCHINSY